MRKLLVLAIVGALSLFAGRVMAEGGSDLEISGNATTVAGWQRGSRAVQVLTAEGILNDGLNAVNAGIGNATFGFYIDQVELDLAKSFGENIRVRSDLDFSPHRADAAGGVYLEQGYVTANVPAGNGVEFLIGRFNSGIGLDPVDRSEMSTVSFSGTHRTLLPRNLTGIRLGYDVSEASRWEFFVVNDLGDTSPSVAPAGFAVNSLPSAGFNGSYAWGSEGNKSWVKLSSGIGSETLPVVGAPGFRPITLLGDLSSSVVVSDAFSVGLEGTIRSDGSAGAANNLKCFGGQLKGRYAFSDVWDGTLRYGIVRDVNGAGTVLANNSRGAVLGPTTGAGLGAAATGGGTLHTVSLATGYHITDGAKFVLEGGVDLGSPTAGGPARLTPGLAGMFAYSF